MTKIKFNAKYASDMIEQSEIYALEKKLLQAFSDLHKGEGNCKLGNGWLNYTKQISEETIREIEECANTVQNHDALIVIGIGGSYIGAKAVINSLINNFSDQTNNFKVYFAGQNVDPVYLSELTRLVLDKDVVINVISKSGTTLETLLAFRILKNELEKKYGKKAKDRIIITTDLDKGALRKYANNYNIKSFSIPDNIGGRYSVLTAVGLLPIAAAGLDIRSILSGANSLVEEYQNFDIKHPYIQYGAYRYLLSKKNKDIEVLVYYQEKLKYFAEWYKQLFAESEAKQGKGIFPSSMMFSTDLHSFGQLLQEGKRNIFETVLHFNEIDKNLSLGFDKDDLAGLNKFKELSLKDVKNCVFQGAIEAHRDGRVPNLIIEIPELNEFFLGQLIYFFEKSCAISALLNGVNPFNQPGVEEYKNKIKTNLISLIEAN